MTAPNQDDRERWLRTCAEQAAAAHACELVEVAVHGSGPSATVAVTIDRPDGVTVEDCARVSRSLGAALDAGQGPEHAYTLEVGSPGLTRPLHSPQDYQRFRGRLGLIQTRTPIAARTRFRGILDGLGEDGATVQLLDEEARAPVSIPWQAIAWGRLDFDAPSTPAGRQRQRSGRGGRP
jgi:ribosome maturation factor RimP